MPEELVAMVEARGINSKQPFHAFDEVGIGSFNNQVEVIGHQAKGMHLPVGLFARFFQCAEKQLLIRVRDENPLAMIAAIHHMINGAWILNAYLASHCKANISKSLQWINKKNYTL